jgi:uncharacterized protein (TIGR03437 family)
MANRYRTLPGQMLALALLLAPAAREASAQAPDFGSPSSYTAQKAPLAIAAADFNGDGAIDIAVANAESQTISIFLGSGVGTFSAGPTISLPTGCQAAYVATGDFTGAAGPDLLAVCPLGPIVVVPNTGHGTFGTPIVTTLPAPAWVGNMLFGYVHPAIADFNGDGHLDVAVPTYDDTNKVTGWYLLLGEGNGQFQSPRALPFTGTYSASLVAGDFNGDGKPDLAAAIYTKGSLALQFAAGHGDGTFATPVAYPLPSSCGSTLQAADLNGDGKLDILITGSSMLMSLTTLGQGDGASAVTVLLGDGKGGFTIGFNISEANYMSGAVLGEILGTGKLDLVEATFASDFLSGVAPTGAVSVRPGHGDGTFGNPISLAMPSTILPTDLAVADFNGDGRPDIAFPSVPAQHYTVALTTDLGQLLASALQLFPVGNVEVALNLTPVAAPVISLGSEALQFSSTGGATPPSQSVDVSNSGGGTLDWTATSSASWLTVSPASGSGSGVLSVSVSPAGLAAGSYSGSISVSAAGAGNSPQSIGVTFAVTAPLPLPTITGVVNGASFQPGFESGSWVTIQGSNLSNTNPGRTWMASEIVDGNLPTDLDGTTVTIDGRPAFVYYISPTQLNVQAPSDSATGPVAVVVTNNGQQSAAFTAQLAACSPAFFLYGGYAIASHYPDYALVGNASAPASPGDILILWGTGFGPTTPAIPAGVVVTGAPAATITATITIGGVAVPVMGTAVLTPGSAGLYQIAIQLPATMPAGAASIQASVGGVMSPASAQIFIGQ